jgi:hypothetical protein
MEIKDNYFAQCSNNRMIASLKQYGRFCLSWLLTPEKE